jgi:hypothetical protein
MELPAEWVAAGFAACAVAIGFLGRAQSAGHKKCEERAEKTDLWIRENLVGLIQDTNTVLDRVSTQMRGIKHEVRDLAPNDETPQEDSESDLHRAVKSKSGKHTWQVLERNSENETTAIIRRLK